MTDTAALMRHLADLQHINQQLRDRLADLEGENAILRAQNQEARAVVELLPPARAVWRVDAP